MYNRHGCLASIFDLIANPIGCFIMLICCLFALLVYGIYSNSKLYAEYGVTYSYCGSVQAKPISAGTTTSDGVYLYLETQGEDVIIVRAPYSFKALTPGVFVSFETTVLEGPDFHPPSKFEPNRGTLKVLPICP